MSVCGEVSLNVKTYFSRNVITEGGVMWRRIFSPTNSDINVFDICIVHYCVSFNHTNVSSRYSSFNDENIKINKCYSNN